MPRREPRSTFPRLRPELPVRPSNPLQIRRRATRAPQVTFPRPRRVRLPSPLQAHHQLTAVTALRRSLGIRRTSTIPSRCKTNSMQPGKALPRPARIFDMSNTPCRPSNRALRPMSTRSWSSQRCCANTGNPCLAIASSLPLLPRPSESPLLPPHPSTARAKLS